MSRTDDVAGDDPAKMTPAERVEAVPARLANPIVLDTQTALRAFWAERRELARAARLGLDFTGAVRPSRAAEEREWLIQQAPVAGPPSERENDVTLPAPPGPRRRSR